jgi:hypothetical protein
MVRPPRLAVLLLLFPSAALAVDPKTPPFAAVVEDNFAKWDKNRDGKLTALEVDAAVRDHGVTGPAAAAAAAVHVFLRTKSAPESVTKVDLLKDHKSDDAGRRDKNGGAANVPGTYRSFNHHLAAVPRQVFAGKDVPHLGGVSQGNVGDCFLISSIGAAVQRNPEFVKRLIREHADGSCELTFPGGRTIRVPKLTDAEVCLGSSAGDQGLWLNVFEKALGELFIASKGPKAPKDIDLDTINRGGDPAEVLRLLTAHQVTTVTLKKKKPQTDTEFAALQAQVHKVMAAEAHAKLLMCCATSGGPLPHGVISDHAYAVVGYDPRTQVVQIWNPWGADYDVKLKPGTTPGLQNGYEVTKGHFSVPLHDFVRVFSDFYFETPAPAKK